MNEDNAHCPEELPVIEAAKEATRATSRALRILRARPDDAAKLTEIAFAAKRHWGYPERWIASWTHLLTVEPRMIIEQETHVAYVDEGAVAFYSLGGGGGRMRMEHLWVLPQKMGEGIGRALFLHALEQARASGSEILEIESDPNAVGFYEHMGARQVGKTVTELEGQCRELPILIYDLR